MITQMQFDYAVREGERIEKLRKSGKYRIVSVDIWEGVGSDMVLGEFDSQEEALAHAYWMTYWERESDRVHSQDSADAAYGILGIEPPSAEHVRELEEYIKKEGWTSNPMTPEQLYISTALAQRILGEEPPSPAFVENLEKEIERIKATPNITSSKIYIYDPEGNLIDEHKC